MVWPINNDDDDGDDDGSNNNRWLCVCSVCRCVRPGASADRLRACRSDVVDSRRVGGRMAVVEGLRSPQDGAASHETAHSQQPYSRH